jgi:hypothetical protein
MISSRLFYLSILGLLLAAPRLTPGADIAWECDFTTTQGWYDNKTSASYMAKVDQYEPSVMRVTQEGGESWGKVAFVVKDVDLDKASKLEALVNKVDLDSAFQIAVASLDWSEFYVVVQRTSADGVHMGDIQAATGWTGKKDFNIVLIVEGKSKAAYFNNLKIAPKEG